jgi:hypothetical protein
MVGTKASMVLRQWKIKLAALMSLFMFRQLVGKQKLALRTPPLTFRVEQFRASQLVNFSIKMSVLR